MPPSHLVEINLISAQGLKPPPPSRPFRTYAVAWIHPSAKLRTALSPDSGENPNWNEKFVFRIPSDLLSPDSASALSVEIYALGAWYFPQTLIGTARLLLGNLRLLLLPLHSPSFAAVGIRRNSGRIHGILNLGAALISRVPVFVTEALAGTSAVCYRDFIGNGGGKAVFELKECDGGDCEGGEGAARCGLGLGLGFRRKIHVSLSDQNLAVLGLGRNEEGR